MKPVYLIALFAALATADKGTAHEFWIDPADFTVESGEALLADLSLPFRHSKLLKLLHVKKLLLTNIVVEF